MDKANHVLFSSGSTDEANAAITPKGAKNYPELKGYTTQFWLWKTGIKYPEKTYPALYAKANQVIQHQASEAFWGACAELLALSAVGPSHQLRVSGSAAST
ncbi:unnamed protein product [Discula destructiva]